MEGNSAYKGKNLKALYALPFAKLPSKIHPLDLTYRIFNRVFGFFAIVPALKNAILGETPIDQILTEVEKELFAIVSGVTDDYADTQRKVQERVERMK